MYLMSLCHRDTCLIGVYLAILEIYHIVLKGLNEVGTVPLDVVVNVVPHASKGMKRLQVMRGTPANSPSMSNLEVMHHLRELLECRTSG